jgi:hypothetical protein
MAARFGLGSLLGASAVGAYGAQQLSQGGSPGVWGLLPGMGSSSWTNSSSPEVRKTGCDIFPARD